MVTASGGPKISLRRYLDGVPKEEAAGRPKKLRATIFVQKDRVEAACEARSRQSPEELCLEVRLDVGPMRRRHRSLRRG